MFTQKQKRRKTKGSTNMAKRSKALHLLTLRRGKGKAKLRGVTKIRVRRGGEDYGDYEDMVDLVYQAPLVHEDQPDMFQRADKWVDTLVDQDAGKNSTIKRVH